MIKAAYTTLDYISDPNERSTIVVRNPIARKLDNLFSEALSKTDTLVLMACLGGYAGGRASVALSQLLRERMIAHSAVVSLPFATETEQRRRKACEHMIALTTTAETIGVLNMVSIEHQMGTRFAFADGLATADRRMNRMLEGLVTNPCQRDLSGRQDSTGESNGQ